MFTLMYWRVCKPNARPSGLMFLTIVLLNPVVVLFAIHSLSSSAFCRLIRLGLIPIEKLWRWVRQQVLHLHRLSDDWERLKQQVLDFIAQFHLGSLPLLHYVGLLPS